MNAARGEKGLIDHSFPASRRFDLIEIKDIVEEAFALAFVIIGVFPMFAVMFVIIVVVAMLSVVRDSGGTFDEFV